MTEPSHLDLKSADAKQNAKAKGSQESGFGETVKVILQALLIALVVRTFLFQPFNIPSGSMIPTLLIGDYLFISKYTYGYSLASLPSIPGLPITPDLLPGRYFASSPKRGDVVVFKFPGDGRTDYIKRLIGLPGDKIQMRDGRLYINDELVPREPIAKVHTKNLLGYDIDAPAYKETLPGGVSHTVIEIEGDSGRNDNTEVFVVPPNHYFMMGDNRDNSSDSRVPPYEGGVGYVPSENLEGRAEMIFFSLDNDEPVWAFWKWPSSVRLGRMFKPVK